VWLQALRDANPEYEGVLVQLLQREWTGAHAVEQSGVVDGEEDSVFARDSLA